MEIKDVREYIDVKITESIRKKQDINIIEYQEILEKIDSMLKDIEMK